MGVCVGFDAGTHRLAVSMRDKNNNIVYKSEINAFLEMPIENRFVFNMMKNAGVPLIERPDEKVAYALGEAAIQMAYSMPNLQIKRPMKDGCLNPQEKHAQQIMSIMIHGLLEDVQENNSSLFYSIPANAINQETDADYHSKTLEAIFKAYDSNGDGTGYRVKPFPINEALALVYAELAKNAYTGLAASFGGGQVNICYAQFGAPVFQFSIVNSGDWIDKMAAKATGENVIFINREKEKVNLDSTEGNLVHRAIRSQYEIMIQKTISNIKKGLEDNINKIGVSTPVDFVIAGGTASATGFKEVFEKTLREVKLPLEIRTVIRPKDPLYSVAKGCLLASEASV